VNWEGLERKRSCLVLRIVAVKNSAFVGWLYVSHRVGVIASEFYSLSLAAVCFACWHLTDRLPRGQGTRVQSPFVLQASRLTLVTYLPSLKIENADLCDRHVSSLSPRRPGSILGQSIWIFFWWTEWHRDRCFL
jgi:hypothetical protein